MGISMFGLKTYWNQLFNLMEIQTNQNFEHFFQAETLNTDNNKSYYQQYDVKRLISFHKQGMIKQQIYENILARKIGVDYSPGIQFDGDTNKPKLRTFLSSRNTQHR